MGRHCETGRVAGAAVAAAGGMALGAFSGAAGMAAGASSGVYLGAAAGARLSGKSRGPEREFYADPRCGQAQRANEGFGAAIGAQAGLAAGRSTGVGAAVETAGTRSETFMGALGGASIARKLAARRSGDAQTECVAPKAPGSK